MSIELLSSLIAKKIIRRNTRIQASYEVQDTAMKQLRVQDEFNITQIHASEHAIAFTAKRCSNQDIMQLDSSAVTSYDGMTLINLARSFELNEQGELETSFARKGRPKIRNFTPQDLAWQAHKAKLLAEKRQLHRHHALHTADAYKIDNAIAVYNHVNWR